MSVANQFELQMLALINQERTSRGLDALKLEQKLNSAAEEHSQWMLETNTFSHTGENGSSPGQRMRDAGFTFSGSWASAENVAWQSERGASGIADDVADLHRALMNSPGHRANILNPDLVYVGIGIEVGTFTHGSYGYESVMVTQNFARTSAPVTLDPQNPDAAAAEDGPNDAPSATNGADSIVLADPQTFEALGGNDTVTGSTGDDDIQGGTGRDLLRGADGDDDLEGGGHRDRLFGGKGDDTLSGDNGNDKLNGGAGRDLLQGDNGADVLNGGGGGDTLEGGTGADVFVFSKGRDTVLDFSLEDGDRIKLSAAQGVQNFSDLAANHMTQNGDNVVISDDAGHKLVLVDTDIETLNASDFLF